MMLLAILDIQTPHFMQDLCPRGNDSAECRGWRVSSLEPREPTEVGGCAQSDWELEPLINLHDEIAMLIF